MYLEAALLLDEYLDVVTISPDEYPAEGTFDVTIFDGVTPRVAAKSGSILYLDPKNQRDNPSFKQYSSALYCAGDDYFLPEWPLGWWGNGKRETSWRMNWSVTPIRFVSTGIYEPIFGRKTSRVKRPSDKVLFVETHYEVVWGARWGFLTPEAAFGWGTGILSDKAVVCYDRWISPPRHRNAGFVAAFCDGSARIIPLADRQAFVNGATWGNGPYYDLDKP